jgi:Ankyrin repeats (3 copies)
VFVHPRCFILSAMKKRIKVRKLAGGVLVAVLLAVCAWGQQTSANAAGDTSLHKAARTGNLSLLKSLLQRGSPDLRDKNGRTPLMDAVAASQLGAIRTLLGSGANVNARAGDGRTPLIEAAVHGRPKSTRLLIAAHADLNYEQRGWGTVLEAAEPGNRLSSAGSSRLNPNPVISPRRWVQTKVC